MAVAAVVLLASRPLASVGRLGAASLVALAAMTAWVTLSRAWSHTPLGSDIDAQRWILYGAVFGLGLLTAGNPAVARRSIVWIAIALSGLIVAALVARLAPSILSPHGQLNDQGRLAWPLTYWNGMGTLAALTFLVALHLSAASSGAAAIRALAAAMLPLAATALFMTFSRGALAAAIAAAVLYLVVARPRGAVAALLVGVPAVGVSVAVAAALPSLTEIHWRTDTTDAHRLAITLMACALASAVARLVLVLADHRLNDVTVPRISRTTAIAGTAVAILGAAALFFATGGPHLLQDKVDAFNAKTNITQTDASRLTTVQNNGRLKMWRAALKIYEAEPVHGAGSNMFRWKWNLLRGQAPERSEAHSLYLETLAELGIVGVVLLALVLLTLVAALARRLRPPTRHAAALALAALVLVLLQAAVDWVWEIPVTTAAAFALLGTAIARPRDDVESTLPAPAKASPDVTTAAPDQPDAAADPIATPAIEPTATPQTREVVRFAIAALLLLLAVLPARVALSEARLSAAQDRFDAGDCPGAVAKARSADGILDRPEAKILLGYCLLRTNQIAAAEQALAKGAQREPGNWIYPYASAVVRAAAGEDPRASTRAALALNPTGAVPLLGVQRLSGTTPAQWKAESSHVPYPARPN